MTTLDDAAERRIQELHAEAFADVSGNAVLTVIRRAWREATEAAAKKCDEYAKQEAEHIGLRVGAEECAAAIRGKGG